MHQNYKKVYEWILLENIEKFFEHQFPKEMELVQFHGKNVCPSKTCYLIQTDFSWQKASRRIVFFCSKKFQPFLNDSHEGFKSNAKKIPRNWSWVALLGLLFLDVHITYIVHTLVISYEYQDISNLAMTSFFK